MSLLWLTGILHVADKTFVTQSPKGSHLQPLSSLAFALEFEGLFFLIHLQMVIAFLDGLQQC